MSTFQKVRVRIEELTRILGKSVAELEKGDKNDYPGEEDRLLGNGTISGWYEKTTDWTSATLEKFLTYYNIDRDWWKTGTGKSFLTSVPEASDNTNKKDPETELRILRQIVIRMGETNDYLLKRLKELGG